MSQTQSQVFNKINSKLGNYYPKIENFHPPKGYQPVKGYEPVNYRPNILNYFLNHKKVPHQNGKIINKILSFYFFLNDLFVGNSKMSYRNDALNNQNAVDLSVISVRSDKPFYINSKPKSFSRSPVVTNIQRYTRPSRAYHYYSRPPIVTNIQRYTRPTSGYYRPKNPTVVTNIQRYTRSTKPTIHVEHYTKPPFVSNIYHHTRTSRVYHRTTKSPIEYYTLPPLINEINENTRKPTNHPAFTYREPWTHFSTTTTKKKHTTTTKKQTITSTTTPRPTTSRATTHKPIVTQHIPFVNRTRLIDDNCMKCLCFVRSQ